MRRLDSGTLLSSLMFFFSLFITSLGWGAPAQNGKLKPIIPFNGSVDHIPFFTTYTLGRFAPVPHSLKLRKAIALLKSAKTTVVDLNDGDLNLNEKKELQKVLLRLALYFDQHRYSYSLSEEYFNDSINLLAFVSRDILKNDRKSGGKARQIYLVNFVKLIRYPNDKNAYSELKNIRDQVPLRLQRPIKLLVNLERSFSAFMHKKSLKIFRSFLKDSKFQTSSGAIVERMIYIRAFAGLDNLGERVIDVNSDLEKPLGKLVEAAAAIDRNFRAGVVGFAADLWKINKGSFMNLPFSLRSDWSLNDTALIERQKIFEGKSSGLMTLYLKTLVSFPDEVALYKRIYFKAKSQFKVTNNFKDFYKIQDRLLNIISRAPISKIVNIQRRFLNDRRSIFIRHAMKKVINNKFDDQVTLDIAQLVEKEIRRNQGFLANKKISAQLVRFYLALGKKERAASIISKMISDDPSIEGLQRVISLQRQVAELPAKVDWFSVPLRHEPATKRLLNLYDRLIRKLNFQKRAVDWKLSARAGMLYLTYGRVEQAKRLWFKYLNKKPLNRNVLKALATLVQYLHRVKDYENLYETILVLKRSGVRPEFSKPDIRLKSYWLDAVYTLSKKPGEQGSQLKYIKEFVSVGQNDARADEVFTVLIRNHENSGDFKAALDVATKLLEGKQKSRVRQKFMKLGYKIATRGGEDAATVAFGLSYLEEFKKDPETPLIRERLLEILRKKKSWRKLALVSLEHVNDDRVRPADRRKYAADILGVNLRYVKLEVKKLAAEYLISHGQKDPVFFGKAISFLAKRASVKNDRDRLAALTEKINEVMPDKSALDRVRTELEFYRVLASIPKNIVLKGSQPIVQLRKIIRLQRLYDKKFQRICDAEKVGRYCGVARFQFAEFTQRLIDEIQSYEYKDDMADRLAEDFYSIRDKSLRKMRRDITLALDVSSRLAKSNEVVRSWKKQIIDATAFYRENGTFQN